MHRTQLKVGAFIIAAFLLQTIQVSAMELEEFTITDDPLVMSSSIAKLNEEDVKNKRSDKMEKKPSSTEIKDSPAKPVAPISHKLVSGDSLSSIAKVYQTTWKKLFDKNMQISNPDLLAIGDIVVIPLDSEVLAERPLPIFQATPTPTVLTSNNPAAPSRPLTSAAQTRNTSPGNTYASGYCTWYAKNRRPDLPNRMGNAVSWVSSAASQGFATGSAPKAGAIGQQGNHVVYVESVNGDGTVTVSEMNYKGLYIISSRTVAASNFTYIY